MDTFGRNFMGDRRITLEHLRVFIAVAERGGFQEAGAHVHRTQSAITQSVKRLEEYMRCRLLERGQGQHTVLTDQGARFLPEAKEILARMDHAMRALQQPELKGHIVLGIQPSTRTDELQTAIASCMAMNKGLRIQVVSEISFRLLEMLDHGTVDVAIACRNKDDILPEGTVQHTLNMEPMYWAGQRSEDFRHAGEIPLVVSVEGCSNRDAAETALKKAGLAYYVAFMSHSWEGIYGAVSSGFGVSAFGRSELADTHTVLGEEHGLPPLPMLRTVLRTKSRSPVIQQFCQRIRGLPAFRDATP